MKKLVSFNFAEKCFLAVLGALHIIDKEYVANHFIGEQPMIKQTATARVILIMNGKCSQAVEDFRYIPTTIG